jgi:hypothetical protein
MNSASRNESSVPSITIASFRNVSIAVLAFFADRNGTRRTNCRDIEKEGVAAFHFRQDRGSLNTVCAFLLEIWK